MSLSRKSSAASRHTWVARIKRLQLERVQMFEQSFQQYNNKFSSQIQKTEASNLELEYYNDDIRKTLKYTMQAMQASRSPRQGDLIAQHLVKKRLKEAHEIIGTNDPLLFSETTEFLRSIDFGKETHYSSDTVTAASGVEVKRSDLGKNDKMLKTFADEFGGYFTIEEVRELSQEMSTIHNTELPKTQTEKTNFQYSEKIVGRGLGGALTFLRERGALNSIDVEWAGRNNDRKLLPHQLLVKDALFSNQEKDESSQRIEVALRRTDEYGRILTAKEAFRELCYHFHGKGPSKNRQQRRVKEYIADIANKKRLTSTHQSHEIRKNLEMQEKLRTPYITLEGGGPSQDRCVDQRTQPYRVKKKLPTQCSCENF